MQIGQGNELWHILYQMIKNESEVFPNRLWGMLQGLNKKAQLTQRERATAVHV